MIWGGPDPLTLHLDPPLDEAVEQGENGINGFPIPLVLLCMSVDVRGLIEVDTYFVCRFHLGSEYLKICF